MHIALAFLIVDAIQNLCIGQRTEGGNGHNLCLTAGEHCRAMHPWNQTNFSCQRTDFVDATTIHTFALVEQPSSDNEFLQFIDALVDLCCFLWILLVELCMDFLDDRSQTLFTNVFVVGVQSKFYLVDSKFFDCLEHGRVYLLRFEGKFRFADFCLYICDELCDLLDFLMTLCNRFEHGFVVHLVGACFDHNDLLAGTGNGQLKVGMLSLLLVRADDDFTIHQTNLHTADWTVPRNIRDGQRKGGTQHTGNLRGVVLINRKNGHNNRNVVAHILREQRTDWAVHQTGGQDCLLGRAALTLDERAGDFTYRIQFFFKIDRQREKVYPFTRFLGSGHIDHYCGIAVANQYRAVCKTSHLACFKADLFAGKLGFKHSKVFKHLSQPP